MLERFKLLLKLEEKDSNRFSIKHLAVTTHGIEKWSEKNKKTIEEAYKKSFKIINMIIHEQVNNNIPILTIYLLPEELKQEEYYGLFLDALINFINQLKDSDIIHKNKIKVSTLGKWYDIPGRAVDMIKKLLDNTKDYDSFFLNLCINYNGQEEIVDACRLIARQVKAEKIEIDNITKDTVKENIYSSYFLPPDIIIKNGKRKSSGLLLWDSVYSETFFTEKYFPDFEKSDMKRVIDRFNSQKP